MMEPGPLKTTQAQTYRWHAIQTGCYWADVRVAALRSRSQPTKTYEAGVRRGRGRFPKHRPDGDSGSAAAFPAGCWERGYFRTCPVSRAKERGKRVIASLWAFLVRNSYQGPTLGPALPPKKTLAVRRRGFHIDTLFRS